MLPIISPVADSQFLLRNINGSTIAGCEKVKGICSDVSKNNYSQRLSVYEVVVFEKRPFQLTTKAK
jgi:hypothetical protein